MPSFDIVKDINEPKSFRAQSVIGNFDLDIAHVREHFKGDIDIENKEWNVGAIVGGSGTGKSTIAKELFPEYYIKELEYSGGCVLDDMPETVSIKDIERTFTSVGFASVPSWLKPYGVLSNGEKMRVDLARCLLEDREIVVFDEFTSVVDRDVAKTAAYAISKAVKRSDKKFIAVSCHKDILDWLEPDWVYDTDEKRFFILRESTTAQQSNLKYIGLTERLKSKYGTYLVSITI